MAWRPGSYGCILSPLRGSRCPSVSCGGGFSRRRAPIRNRGGRTRLAREEVEGGDPGEEEVGPALHRHEAGERRQAAAGAVLLDREHARLDLVDDVVRL